MSLARDLSERKLAVALVEAYQGRSLRAAAVEVGIGTKRAAALLRRFKVRPRDKVHRHGGSIPSSIDPRTAADEAEAATRRAALVEVAEGMTVRAMAEMFGTSPGAISRLLRAAGIQRKRGHTSSVSADEVERMRQCGWSYQEIGDVLGVSRVAVAAAFRDGRRAAKRVNAADVVRLRDEHRFAWADIGRHLDCHPDTAKKTYYKAKAAGAAAQMLAGNVG